MIIKYDLYHEARLKGRLVRNNIAHRVFSKKETAYFDAVNLIAVVSQKDSNFKEKYDDMRIYIKETYEDGHTRLILNFTIQLAPEKGDNNERN